MKKSFFNIPFNTFLLFFIIAAESYGQFTDPGHKAIPEGVEAINQPGYYGKEGTTYMLTQDITSDKSAIFLGKDITLDLNGYTITYADGNYEHIPNYSFEEGLESWDISKAPGAKIEDTKVHVFIGDKILRLKAGEEITSEYVNLPLPNRSYFAMCGVIGPKMKVSVVCRRCAW